MLSIIYMIIIININHDLPERELALWFNFKPTTYDRNSISQYPLKDKVATDSVTVCYLSMVTKESESAFIVIVHSKINFSTAHP